MTDQHMTLAILWTHPDRSDAELLCEAAQREFGLNCEIIRQGLEFQTRAHIDRSDAGLVLAWARTYMTDLYRQHQIYNRQPDQTHEIYQTHTLSGPHGPDSPTGA